MTPTVQQFVSLHLVSLSLICPGGGDSRHRRRALDPREEDIGIYSMDRMVLDGGPFPQATPTGPYFDPDFRTNISVMTAGRAVLNCRVYNIGNRTVSELSRKILRPAVKERLVNNVSQTQHWSSPLRTSH